MSDNNLGAAALINIANSYNTPQSLGKGIFEKLPRSSQKNRQWSRH